MRRIKKKIYLGTCAAAFAVLTIVRYTTDVVPESEPQPVAKVEAQEVETPVTDTIVEATPAPQKSLPIPKTPEKKHPVRGVHSYADCFPDIQDVQIVAARKWGVSPVEDRQEAEQRKSELVFVGSSPYYVMDRSMSHSIPYLVPRAADLLDRIGRNFIDSLFVKGIPFHNPIITSVLRTENDVRRLRSTNPNASPESCHRFGTTFDIAYNRYHTVCPPGEHRRAVRDDSLKYVLSEVLRDLRKEGRCFIKYEVKQGCFHITTR